MGFERAAGGHAAKRVDEVRGGGAGKGVREHSHQVACRKQEGGQEKRADGVSTVWQVRARAPAKSMLTRDHHRTHAPCASVPAAVSLSAKVPLAALMGPASSLPRW